MLDSLSEEGLEFFLLLDAYERLSELTLLEYEDGGDGANAELTGEGTILVHIHLEDFYTVIDFVDEFFEDGAHRAAGATPGGPEIDKGLIGCADGIVKRIGGKGGYLIGHDL